jgi:hypothetical protein
MHCFIIDAFSRPAESGCAEHACAQTEAGMTVRQEYLLQAA